MNDGLYMRDGFVDREEVRLLVWFDGEEASIAGPAVDDLPWVAKALYAVANQWHPQEEQDVPPMPPQSDHGSVLDCTSKDLAVVVFKTHTVVVKHGEIFPNSGLASYDLEVAGRRRHDTEWAVTMLSCLAMSIEQQGGFDHVI